MKQRRLPAAFVVTVSAMAGTGACHTEEPVHANPPPQEPQWNPPPPPSDATEPADAAPVESAPDAASEPVHWNPPPPTSRTLNPTDPRTQRPILKAENGCVIDPGLDAAPGVGRQPRPHPVKCPAAMKDPAWGACLHGTLETTGITDADGGALCSCNNHGNPPRVLSVACPALR